MMAAPCKRCVMSDEQEQDSSPLVPIEQQTIIFYGKPLWLAGIDPKRVREEIRPEILRYQREVVDVLYAWAQSPKVTDPPATLVPAEQIIKPVPPADDAGLEVWREYHRQMVAWIDWQHAIETWRGSVESRLEGLVLSDNYSGRCWRLD